MKQSLREKGGADQEQAEEINEKMRFLKSCKLHSQIASRTSTFEA
jgi:hypothetical protein